jgi:hypothetical protein
MPHEDRPNPWCRATITARAITLNRWTPALIRGGPRGMVLDRLGGRGVTIADLARADGPGGGELLVDPVTRGGWTAAEPTLLGWAATAGYRRVWLPDRVLDLDVAGADVGCASVTCPTCGLPWHDDTVEFWELVRREGAFPGFCLACGGSLPEWTVAVRSGDLPATTFSSPTERSAR